MRIYDRPLNADEMLWLSEGDPYTQIPDPPHPTDLVMDGKMGMDNLGVFVEWRMKGL